MHRLGKVLFCLLFCIGLFACAPETAVSGRLIVWHTWDGAEAPIIEEVLADFQEIHPDIQLSVERKRYDTPAERIRLVNELRTGLGPDVIVGINSPFAHSLYRSGLIKDLNETAVDWAVFDRSTLQSVQRDNNSYVGVPLNAYVSVLYFNRTLVEEPPATFEALENMASATHQVGIPTTFFASYWGISGFNGTVFEGDALAENSADSMARWLAELKTFQQKPGFVLSPDVFALADSFAQGDLALLVSDSRNVATFEEAMGAEQLGMALIPDLDQASMPLSTIDVIVVNSASAQDKTAVLLSNFLINDAQQRKLARATSGRSPVNKGVSLNPTLFPRVSIIMAQSQTAVVPTTVQDDLINQLIPASDLIYPQVLEGVLSPTEGAQAIIERVTSNEDQE